MLPLLLFASVLQGARGLPVPPEGWTVEVVAEAPRVKHPSVVACAPDGRVFVGEDPMDISVPAHETKGRILCFHPDGRVTVFAEGLYAPFGLLYLEGKLYVNHAPRFTVFTDEDGVGRDRVDLIRSTNPEPWALDWNDHVPANFRLAMDGYFYMSVGDKGIYGAVGRDGGKVELRGGGVLRLRPDATGLEVYSTGTRNHLDVQINDEDEVFTYDNTDEKGWWSRVTHMVEGGQYAYPWEHQPRRPWTLWRMGEYGAGAATAGLCYTEDALPEEYRGALLLADFGKRNILHVRIARDGGSYRILEKKDFFRDMPGDFMPVGLAVSADGLSLYIGDWKHPGSKAKVVVGRLLKVTYTGKSLAAPKPGWYLAAATGKPFEATMDELLAGLAHPSHAVRITAQRRIAGRGREAVGPLSGLLGQGGTAARHAVWALDAIDGGASARPALLEALKRPGVRLQSARQLGTRRVPEALGPMIGLLEDPDAAMRFRAATALGRLGKIEGVPALVAALGEKDFFTRYAVFTAIHRIGRADPAAWAAAAKGLESADPRVREGTLFAMRETFELGVVAALAAQARRKDLASDARAAALGTLGALHRRTPAWKGEWWAYHPVDRPPPAKSVEWEGTGAVLAELRAALDDPEAAVRRAAVVALREAGEKDSAARLRGMFPGEKDVEVRRAILRTLGAFKDAGAESLLGSVVGDGDPLLIDALVVAAEIGARDFLETYLSPRVRPGRPDGRITALEGLGQLKAAGALGVVAEQLSQRDPYVRAAAVAALGQIGGGAAAEALLPLLGEKEAGLRRGVIEALGRVGDRRAVPGLVEAFGREETRFEAASALARMPDARALDAYLFGLGSPSQALRDASRKAVVALGKGALPAIEAKLDGPGIPPQAVGELQKIFAKEKGSRLHAAEAKTADPVAYLEFALKNAGDAGRGRKVFFDPKGPACAKCHRVAGEGGEVGPDLSGVGGQFARRELAEGVLVPSARVREGYQQVVVRTRGGEIVSGAVKTESADELTLIDVEAKKIILRKGDIAERKTSELSLMPEGLQAGLSLQDFADLVAFLESLKQK